MKLDAFRDGSAVTDPYTHEQLAIRKADAKLRYGDEWTEHLAEADHIHPLERIHESHKSDAWTTNDDIRKAANSPDNLEITSRKINNAKRSRTNEEFINDREYRESKGIKLSESSERKAIERGRKAQQSIDSQLRRAGVKNIASTFHNAGMSGAQYGGITALTMSGIMNITALVKGEKSAGEAIADTVKDGGKGALTGYVMGGGLTAISHTLANTSSKFLQALSKSGTPGQVVTAVMTLGGTVKRFASGEINTEQFMLELGDKGLGIASASYGFAVGQMMIPVPVIGGAIGALIGSMLTSEYYHGLINALKTRQLERAERERVIAECKRAVEQEKAYRAELEAYLRSYFREYRECFDEAISQIHFAFVRDDADGIIAAANKITRKLGGKIRYENAAEFREFFASGAVIEL